MSRTKRRNTNYNNDAARPTTSYKRQNRQQWLRELER